MTFEEAKQRSDYKFDADYIEMYIDEIRNNHINEIETVRGIAILEIGYVDLELNICPVKGKSPIMDYFCCIKADNYDNWEEDKYLDYNIKIDWSTGNWKEQLEKNMFEALDGYIKSKNYSYDEPNHLIDEEHTIKALLEDLKNRSESYADIEIYEPNSRGRYYPDHFHTDNCTYITPDLSSEQYLQNTEVGFYELMDEEEYNNTILANTEITADFGNWYGNKDVKILCIMVK